MNRSVHALFVPVEFPAGIAPGEGGDFNTLTVARNGRGQPVLRGTSLAGALRHAWRKHLRNSGLEGESLEDAVKCVFGYALGDDDGFGGEPSRLQVGDCVLHTGAAGEGGTVMRTHHLRDRHRGSVAHGGLFSLEACPPGTHATIALWLQDDDQTPDEAPAFLEAIIQFLASGMTLGGKAARGVGMTRLARDPVYRCYDLTDLKDHAAWLDDQFAWRADSAKIPAGRPMAVKTSAAAGVLEVHFTLAIPRGQDVLIGDGQGLEHEIEPQRVRAADGRDYWRLPGASLRGLFRGWVTRLAARDGQLVADNVQRQQRVWRGELSPANESLQRMSGDNLGWCFLPQEERRQGRAKTGCPVAALFGTLFQAGRIHIADALAPCGADSDDGDRTEEQLRKHVAVDRITGGAAEGMLFENTVLTAYSDGRSPRFAVTMRLQQATEREARWLADTLRALDLGILRVGSSKSSGRLALSGPPQASGPGEHFFTEIRPVNDPVMF
jgi:CRISPR/Cas system CSM-associated protein Csm3 (group 7 of RAMP superfamily)